MTTPKFHKIGMTPSQAEETISAAKGALEALLQLEALTKSIMNELKEHPHGTVYQLAKLGNFHAMDQANVTDCMIESVERGEVK